MRGLREVTVNSNNSDAFKHNGETIEERHDDEDDFVDAPNAGLQLPLPKAKWEGDDRTVGEPAWRKGGTLPPRLYNSHDFRPMPNHQLAEPDRITKHVTLR